VPISVVRDATAKDLPKLKEIVDSSFPVFYRFFAWHSLNEPEEPVLVAESEGAVAGYTKLIEFKIGKVTYGCILWVAVHPKFRRRGIALHLTVASVKCLKRRGANMVFASTQRTNNGALATLTKAGFFRIGFLRLWRLFGWRVISFYGDIWFAPGEVVLVWDGSFDC
jgi:ribosomal protein S18 acetylase RimI-like enzyme